LLDEGDGETEVGAPVYEADADWQCAICGVEIGGGEKVPGSGEVGG